MTEKKLQIKLKNIPKYKNEIFVVILLAKVFMFFIFTIDNF